MKIIIINGPNLNLLGSRNTKTYGSVDFEDFFEDMQAEFTDHRFEYFQSNVEGELIDALHQSAEKFDGAIINAGGYTHTSVALGDAVEAVGALGLPTVEVHVSNILGREDYRHSSMLSRHCIGSLWGFGLDGYRLGVRALEYSDDD